MTDRLHSLTVVLEEDLRVDDAELLIAAIGMMRGVLSVSPNVSDTRDLVAQMRARGEWRDTLLAVAEVAHVPEHRAKIHALAGELTGRGRR